MLPLLLVLPAFSVCIAAARRKQSFVILLHSFAIRHSIRYCSGREPELFRRAESANLILREHVSSHLVYHCRLNRGICCKIGDAYASVAHVDNRTGHHRLNYRRRRDPSVLSAKRRRPISPRRHNRFHSWRDPGPFSLAQVPPACAARIMNGRAQPPGAPTPTN